MQILFLTHFFKPETGAASVRADYFVKSLRKAGHEVLVIAPKPNYPLGKIFDGYNKSGIIANKDENIIYLPIFFVGARTPFGRLISYISYFLFSFFYLLFKVPKPDIILSSSPPLFTSLSTAFYSKIKRCKFILDIRDIWPDIGVELGILNKNILIAGLREIEKYLYKNAEKIIVTAEGDKVNINSKLSGNNKCEIIYNGADTSVFNPLNETEKNEIREKYNIPINQKVLIYFGSYNHGMNDIDTMGKFLISEKVINNEFHFLSIGSGDNLDSLIQIIEGQISYTSINSLPMEEVALLVAASDISIIPRKSIINDTGGNIPVKCFESWAAGIPVLLSNIEDAEVAKIFNSCGAGVIVPPDNKEDLVLGLNELLTKDLKQLGLKGRQFVIEKYDRIKQSELLVDLIENV